MSKKRILVIDDDPKIPDRVKTSLEKEGFCVDAAGDGVAALGMIKANPPDLVVLDITFPGSAEGDGATLDGIEILRRLREEGDVPILMLSSTSIGAVKVMALSLGADDYLTKPFDSQELAARVKAILRRAREDSPGERALSFNRLRIDPESRRVWKDDESVDLTAIEFELLHTLARRPGRVFTRDNLIEQAWKYSYYGVPKVVDVHIGHIRKKIEDNPTMPEFIVTVRGTGYRFDGTPL